MSAQESEKNTTIRHIRRYARNALRHATGRPTAIFSWTKYVRKVFDRYNVDLVGWPNYIRIDDPKRMTAEERGEILTLFGCGTINIRRILQKERPFRRQSRLRMSSKIEHRRQPRNDAGKKRIRTNSAMRKQSRRFLRDDFSSPEFAPRSWDKPPRKQYIMEIALPPGPRGRRQLRK